MNYETSSKPLRFRGVRSIAQLGEAAAGSLRVSQRLRRRDSTDRGAAERSAAEAHDRGKQHRRTDELGDERACVQTHAVAHHSCTRAAIASRTARVRSSISSGSPRNDEGSRKGQCRRAPCVGMIGHISALVSSHTVTT